jgi:Cu/Zn superoxide dismutase
MAQDVVINGVTYPAVESVALTDADGNTIVYHSGAGDYEDVNEKYY